MSNEFAVKQNDFGRLIGREEFLWKSFHSRLRYRVPANDNGFVYVEILGHDQTESENAKKYIRSFLDPKQTIRINSSTKTKSILSDDEVLNRLMKEFVVHIDVREETHCYRISLQSSDVMTLYLAMDELQQFVSTNVVDPSMSRQVSSELMNLSAAFERELSIVDEKNSIGDEQRTSNDEEVDQQKFRARCEPSLTTALPGAESKARVVNLAEIVKPTQRKSKKQTKTRRETPKKSSDDDQNENELATELREKLKGRDLRHIIIDGPNIGRTYGREEFSSRGIRIAVDLFHSFGFPDSKLTVIVPPHYLSKDSDGVFQELTRRKILHTSFHQTIEGERKRFYDDRLIVDIAVVRKGIILSNDFYRDLSADSGEAVRKAIRERLLCYRFFGDDLILPNPVFEGGARLEDFLSK